jgi:hypothetical protein
VTFVEQLKRLAEWRDRYKPAAPIWMTETGYDTGGPIGTNERTQAARLPRVVALCLANGIDKVMVYRESGSTPSQHAASGVLREDLSRRPSWYTYATLIRELQGAKPEYHLPQKDDNIWLQTWRRDGKTMLMAYCVRGEAELGVELGKATVTDAFGGVTQVASTRELALSEFPLYISDMADESALEPLSLEAKHREQERKHQRDADAQRTAYLYCFGEVTEPLAVDIGKPRYYTPVPASFLYDAKSGYGFVGKPAAGNDYRQWLAARVERHAVQLDKDQVFQWDVKPGVYELRVNASPPGDPADLILAGASEGPLTLTFEPGKGETMTRQIKVAGGSLRLRATGRCLLRWLVLTEK